MGFCINKTTIANSCNQKNQTLNLPLWGQPNVSSLFVCTLKLIIMLNKLKIQIYKYEV